MENKSIVKKNDTKPWKTPLSARGDFFYKSIFHTYNQIHFFFETKSGEVHVLTIDMLQPYKLYPKVLTPAWIKKALNKHGKTLQIWNTSFLKDADILALLDENKNPFQHIIAASNQVIEFIFETPKWEVFHGRTVQELLYMYAKNRYKQKFAEWM